MNTKIRVCIISGAYPKVNDGIGDYTAKLVNSFNKDNLEVSLITSKDEAIRKNIEKNNNFRILPIIKKWNIFALIAILRLIKNERFDIIHLQFPSTKYRRTVSLCFLPFFIRMFFRDTKTVITLHEFSISYPINKLRQILLSLGSHKVVVTDRNELSQLRKFMVNGTKKIVFIPIGSNIEVYEYSPKEKESFLKKSGIHGQAKIITFFGFVHPNKGIEYLLKSIRKVIDNGIPVQLVVIAQLDFANNAYHNKLKKLMDSLRINESIFITGYTAEQEVSRFLSFSDICVLPFCDGVTLRRGTLIAALAHGKPVVATKSNRYIPFQLRDKENIYFIPVNDVKGLAKAIELLCAENELREKIAAGASLLAKEFSWDKIARAHEMLYQNILG